MNPKYPIYIPSKGRSETRFTMKAFDAIGVPYTVVVEPQEYATYSRVIQKDRLLVTPHRDQGLTETRNFIWDYAASMRHRRFWTFDDNIKGLFRFNRNLKTPVSDGTILRCVEEFADRYENIEITGLNYFMFVKRKFVIPPFTMNTRIYSNMLLRGDSTYRNVTFFNDDTDLCLRVLKDGLCTVLFNAFLILKETTMTVKGGMTDYYNKTDRRREFAEELQRAHPDVTKITERWGRVHHYVDYSGFRQKLRRKPGVEVSPGVDNFGMRLERNIGGNWTYDHDSATSVKG